MTTLADDKQVLRKTLRRIRQAIPTIQRLRAARAVARHALRCAPLRRARRVAVYLAMSSELPTAPLIAAIQARGIRVFAPALVRGALRFRALGRACLQQHRLGMQQPRTGIARRAARMDVIVLPLLGFDAHGTRLGQGGGYYDRALSGCRFRPYRLGLAYAQQQVAALPREAWDQSLHAVLTERGLHAFHRHFSG